MLSIEQRVRIAARYECGNQLSGLNGDGGFNKAGMPILIQKVKKLSQKLMTSGSVLDSKRSGGGQDQDQMKMFPT